MRDNFDWSVEDDLAVDPVNPIAVYENASGEIVIRQQDYHGDNDQMIIVPKQYFPMLVDSLNGYLSQEMLALYKRLGRGSEGPSKGD